MRESGRSKRVITAHGMMGHRVRGHVFELVKIDALYKHLHFLTHCTHEERLVYKEACFRLLSHCEEVEFDVEWWSTVMTPQDHELVRRRTTKGLESASSLSKETDAT